MRGQLVVEQVLPVQFMDLGAFEFLQQLLHRRLHEFELAAGKSQPVIAFLWAIGWQLFEFLHLLRLKVKSAHG